jgi:glycosyltransferase involved in cell wall biosynthesis
MTTLSVVIPAYNEEDGIAEIANRVLAVREQLVSVGVSDLELLVVDDGSSDKTADIAGSIAGVTLVRHIKNKGYGAALKTGFGRAKGDLIGFLDADGTYPPEYFPEMCVKAMNGTDLVIGSRMSGADSEMPATRRLGNFFFANLLSLVSAQKITDSASGMRVFKKEVLKDVYPLPDGLNLTPVMSTRALHEGVKMAESPIPYSERLGRSKLNIFTDGYLFLHSIIWTALTYNPVRILGWIGLGSLGVSLLVGLWLIVARLGGTTTLSAWGVAAVFAALVAGVTGVSIFSLGVSFNYLVSLFYKKEIRQGLFGRPVFKSSLETHFGWMGVVSVIAGISLAVTSLVLGGQGWEIARLWLYLVGSAMLTLIGVQLFINWILVRVLDQLSQREVQIANDLQM